MTPIVWVVVQCDGKASEPWKCYDSEQAARQWVDAVKVKGTSPTYEIYPLAVLTNAFA